ncbi:MAG: antibiotic biosynthesis monooxygenase family protein [Acidimicrobiales bacterium]
MVRVIYRWRVEQARHDEFASWWHDGTLQIRATHPGAMGSTLLRPADGTAGGDGIFVGLARWQSMDHLTAFWARVNPLQFTGAVMESLEILEEIDHLTLEAGPAGP